MHCASSVASPGRSTFRMVHVLAPCPHLICRLLRVLSLLMQCEGAAAAMARDSMADLDRMVTRDLSGAVCEMQRVAAEAVQLPPGRSISWSGQLAFLERASAKLTVAAPATLPIIFVLRHLTFRRLDEAMPVTATRRRGRSRWPACRPSSASSCCAI
jgi:hypothetical protein